MPSTKAVIFDLGNVLVFFDHRRACANIARMARTSPETVFAILFKSGLEQDYEAGKYTTAQMHAILERELRCPLPIQELRQAVSDIFTLNAPTIDILKELKETGIPLIALSNTSEVHIEYLQQNYAFLHLFDYKTYSFEVKAMKPQREIYEHALQHLNIAAESLFFTDDIPHNIEGAQAVGIDAHLFKNAADLRAALVARKLL